MSRKVKQRQISQELTSNVKNVKNVKIKAVLMLPQQD